jgi:anti-sigma factor RsiW
MTEYIDRLSAYIDGELTEQELRSLEAELEIDPALRAALEELQMANDTAVQAFQEMLSEPVPPSLVAAIQSYQPPAASNLNRAPTTAWLVGIAASLLVALFLGYGMGVSTSQSLVASSGGWLEDIADYHAVYEGQKRHLVEVPASESDHIETWLGKTVGVAFKTPDLSEKGLTYRGARLLAAAGKPVAQLIYTDVSGGVIALCMIAANKPDQPDLANRLINGYQMTSWHSNKAGYVVVAPVGQKDIEGIAKSVQRQV